MISISDLKDFRDSKRELQELLLELRELKATRENLPAVAFHGGGRSGSKSSPVESVIIQIERLEVLYAEKLAESITQQIEIEGELKQLQVEDSMILRAYYIRGKTWQDVADTFGVDIRTVHRKHKKLLEKLSA